MIEYYMLGEDPYGGETRLVTFPRPLAIGEIVYVNSRWLRVEMAGLTDDHSAPNNSKCCNVAILRKAFQ